MGKSRKRVPIEVKRRILRRHLLEGVPAERVCAEHGIAPGTLRQWRREFFEHGERALAQGSDSAERKRLLSEVESLRRQLHRERQVAAFLARSSRLLDGDRLLARREGGDNDTQARMRKGRRKK